uniref:rRNA-processing protein EFG1 n=1 Tax=Aplanochytrium stocchinoi TaxID=215587 RepID=A0A7S3LR99_9STRA
MSRKVGGSKRPLSRYDIANKGKGGSEQENEVQAKKGSVKNQIRSLKRLLNKKKFTGKVLEKKQRELEHLEKLIVKRKNSERDKALAKKYHKVRFFERIKVTRKIKKIERAIATANSNGDKEELENKKIELENDLTYVMRFPKGHKYISLFGEGLSEKQLQTRNELRALAIKSAEKNKDEQKTKKAEKRKNTDNKNTTKTVPSNPDNHEQEEGPDDDADDFFL